MERRVNHVRKALGTKIRSLRKERGWSQEALGEREPLQPVVSMAIAGLHLSLIHI